RIPQQFEILKSNLPHLEKAQKFLNLPLPKYFGELNLSNNLKYTISILSNFVQANQQVLEHFAEGVLWCNPAQFIPLFEEVKIVNHKALEILKDIQQKYPIQVLLVKTISVSQFLLRLKKEYLTLKYENGFLDDKVYDEVFFYLDFRHNRLQKENPVIFKREFKFTEKTDSDVTKNHLLEKELENIEENLNELKKLKQSKIERSSSDQQKFNVLPDNTTDLEKSINISDLKNSAGSST
ncbi:hypothetical protein HK099_002101, partial [Clydaea vesicula]